MEWRSVHSLNNKYEVNAKGEIRNAKSKKIVKKFVSKHGYCITQVAPSPGEKKNIRIHCIVAEAFLGDRPDGYVVNHKDGNKLNNTPENLEYVSSSENNIHALQHGLRKPASFPNGHPKHGEMHYNSSITQEKAEEIIKLKSKGIGPRKAAKISGVSFGVVSGIYYRNNWKKN